MIIDILGLSRNIQPWTDLRAMSSYPMTPRVLLQRQLGKLFRYNSNESSQAYVSCPDLCILWIMDYGYYLK